ncbi:glycosyltransferase family 4 protein [bacterium]|nr:glycosyltransferase family 4 protein [candidate division CSSED10-310 bacterium]
MNTGRSVGFVIQRYGDGVDGGAEQHCRWVAEHLAAHRPVEVITTCARDYITWRNHFPAGHTELNGVRVRRFPTTEERELTTFNRLTAAILAAPRPTEEAQVSWLKAQGPLCPELIEYLVLHGDSYAAIFLYTYLYYPTVLGSNQVRRAILVPTAHDEPVIRLPLFQSVFRAPRVLLFLTAAEREFVRSLFNVGDTPSRILDIGITVPEADMASFRARYGLSAPFILYAGRIDEGKGCLELVRNFLEYKRDGSDDLQLVLIGRLHAGLPDHPDIRYLGYLDDSDKAAALRCAEIMAAPSPFESLGIAALEAQSVGVPILVNGRCTVLVGHCREGNGGLWYDNCDEFIEVLRELRSNQGLRATLGANGRAYAAGRYTWSRALDILEWAIAKAAG